MHGSPLHDTPEIVNADLSPRGNLHACLLTAELALVDEILVRLCSERQNKKDQTQSEGRCFHERPFRR
jgi:hypothetical protein